MKKIITIFILLIFYSHNEFAQIGGKYTYEFLSLPASSRVTALAGVGNLVKDFDLNLGITNPALLNPDMNNSIAFNHNFHFAGISNGNIAFAKKIKGQMYQASFTYLNYGDFKSTNVYDETLGTFSASERAIILGTSRKLNERFDAGINLKTIFSSLESYKSIGIAADLALNYNNVDKNFIATFLVKNLGGELSTYNKNKLTAPLDIQIGFSKKLTHLPLRFTIMGHQLQQWNVRYDNPNEVKDTNIFGQNNEPSNFSKNIDNLFRHILFNAELSLGKSGNFKLRGGYNHFRRKELNLSTFRSMAGFSLGFGLKVSKFNIDYGLGYYHLGGATNHLSIATNIDRFRKNI